MKEIHEFSYKLSQIFSNIYCKENSDIRKLDQINCWKKNICDIVKLFYLLNDDDSKEVFIKVLQLYLGYSLSHTKMDDYALYTKNHWKQLENEAVAMHKAVADDYILDRIETYLLKGYEYKNICKAEHGDYVLDCGAYTGNTSIYFSELVGEQGKVFSFEAMPQTYDKLCKNTSDYKNIFAYNYAIYNQEKQLKFTQNDTPGSRVCDDSYEKTIHVQGISIDSFVERYKIKKVDFIKMDIEGAEINALEGCRETCKKFAPRLAICIYHKGDDWIKIPKKIKDLNSNYAFYLKHNSNSLFETVLFAVCTTKKDEKIKVDQEEIKSVMKEWRKFEFIYYIKKILMYCAYYGVIGALKNFIKKISLQKNK